MGSLKGLNGVWLESEEDRVKCLVSEVFEMPVSIQESRHWGVKGCPMSKEDL